MPTTCLMTSDAVVEEVEADVSAALARRIGEGDRSAESEMVERYGRGLLLLLVRRTGDPALADDLYQDTFRTVIERLRREPIEDAGRLAGYLRGIANNLAVAHHRKQVRRATESDSEFVAKVPDLGGNPVSRLSDDQLAGVVHTLLSELGQERDREILRRFYVLEQSKEEICADLAVDGIRFNGVLHRAKRRFREVVVRHERTHGLRLVE